MRDVAQQRLGGAGKDQQGDRAAPRAHPAAHALGDGGHETVVTAGQGHRNAALDEGSDVFRELDRGAHGDDAIEAGPCRQLGELVIGAACLLASGQGLTS